MWTNSCTLEILFFHPFQLLAWEPGKEEEVSMVTARPNFQDSVHVGYVTGLKKFTEYYTSVLCFTTPGDGPRSPPKALRTHEDSKRLLVAASASQSFGRRSIIHGEKR